MDVREAMEQRHSVRKYGDEPLSDEMLGKLRAEVEEVNSVSGLDIRLVTDDPRAFSGLMGKFTGFSGKPAYFAMIGDDSEGLNEAVGYYGERLVLFAQSIGLSTCWAAVCSKKRIGPTLKEGQRMVIGIAVGYGAESGKPHKNRPLEEVADDDGAPLWFLKGMEAVMLAPTAMNKQSFHFSLDGDRVVARNKGGWLTEVDLGIAKYHFEKGCGLDRVEWA